MPNLNFHVTGVEAVAKGMTPLLHFSLQISASPLSTEIHALILSAQIQIECPQRSYNGSEKGKLVELFGKPERWGETLRNRLLGHSHTTVSAFTGSAETILEVPCSYDLNLATAKYFYALEQGEVALLFLFSGSVFYGGPEGRLQVERISWSKECRHRVPVEVWKQLMEQHYPNSAWVSLHRDTFDKLYTYKRSNGLATWEQAIEGLLQNERLEPGGMSEHALSTVQVEVPR